MNKSLKIVQCHGIDVELPLHVGTHFLLHLIDLLKCKHTLTNDTLGLVRISIITNNL